MVTAGERVARRSAVERIPRPEPGGDGAPRRRRGRTSCSTRSLRKTSEAIEDGRHVDRAIVAVEAKRAAILRAPGRVGVVDRRHAAVRATTGQHREGVAVAVVCGAVPGYRAICTSVRSRPWYAWRFSASRSARKTAQSPRSPAGCRSDRSRGSRRSRTWPVDAVSRSPAQSRRAEPSGGRQGLDAIVHPRAAGRPSTPSRRNQPRSPGRADLGVRERKVEGHAGIASSPTGRGADHAAPRGSAKARHPAMLDGDGSDGAVWRRPRRRGPERRRPTPRGRGEGAMGLANQVAIIGTGTIRFGENFHQSYTDMVYEAASLAMADAGVETQEIQAGWLRDLRAASPADTRATPGLSSATRSASRRSRSPAGGGVLRVGDGGRAERRARGRIGGIRRGPRGGRREDAREVPSRGSPRRPGHGAGAPCALQGPHGPGHVLRSLATRYFKEYGIDESALGAVAVKNHWHGSLNPNAHFQRAITLSSTRARRRSPSRSASTIAAPRPTARRRAC